MVTSAAVAFSLASCAAGDQPIDQGDGGGDDVVSGDDSGPACQGADTRTDKLNCGACGHKCAAAQICQDGACKNQCAPPTIKCAGQTQCVDTQKDPLNCGQCSNICTAPSGGVSEDAGTDADDGQRIATPICNAGSCDISCPPDSTPCTDGCFVTSHAPANCGSCGNKCTSGQSCRDGVCCEPAKSVCSGACVDTTTDVNNCGGCGSKCSVVGETCNSGQCGCPSGQKNCGGLCVDVQSDPTNCGSCGTTCLVLGQFCSSGQCTCPSGQSACSGACIDTTTDVNNCGACGKACTVTGESCVSGQCQCPQGDKICSNACVDTSSDPKNCGNCGVICGIATPYCSAGNCTAAITYDEQFTFGTTYTSGTPQYDHWVSFLATLSGNSYTTITVSGTGDPTGVTCATPSSVQQITAALHNGTATAVLCNLQTWYVSKTCGGYPALAVGQSACSCGSNYAVQPTYPGDYWGGVKTNSCGPPPSQEIKVAVQ